MYTYACSTLTHDSHFTHFIFQVEHRRHARGWEYNRELKLRLSIDFMLEDGTNTTGSHEAQVEH